MSNLVGNQNARVQRKIVLVVNFFIFFFCCSVVAVSDLVQDVEAIFHLP